MPVARNTWAAELDLEADISRAPADHAIGVDPVHRLLGQHIRLADRRPEEEALAVLADPGGGEILVDEGFELVVRRHLVALSAFLVQPHPPALIAWVIVIDLHGDDGANAREAVDHDANQRAIAAGRQAFRCRCSPAGVSPDPR